jgi:hypothetical protein
VIKAVVETEVGAYILDIQQSPNTVDFQRLGHCHCISYVEVVGLMYSSQLGLPGLRPYMERSGVVVAVEVYGLAFRHEAV